MVRVGKRTDVQWSQNKITYDHKTANQSYTVTEDDGIEIMFSPHIDTQNAHPQFGYGELEDILDIIAYIDDNQNNSTQLEKIPCNLSLYERPKIKFGEDTPTYWYSLNDIELLRPSSSSYINKHVSFAFVFWARNQTSQFWQDSTALRDVSKDVLVRMYARTKYVDLSDIDNPVRIRQSWRGTWDLVTTHLTVANALLVPHEVTLEDSVWFSFFEPDPVRFLQLQDSNEMSEVKKYFNFPSPQMSLPLMVQIRMDESTIQYKRKFLNLSEVIGLIGGIFAIFEATLGLLLWTLSFYSFKRDIKTQVWEANRRHEETLNELQQLKDKFKIVKVPEREEMKRGNKEEESKEEERKLMVSHLFRIK